MNHVDKGILTKVGDFKWFPSINDLINKPIKEKNKVLAYMKQSKIDSVTAGSFIELIDNKTEIYAYSMSDGKYSWSSYVVYNVKKYDMELPKEFVQHVLNIYDM